MKIIKFLLLIVICFTFNMSAQKINIMATYAHSDLIYSPGFEVNYFFKDRFGIEVGISSFLFNYKPNQIVNQSSWATESDMINEYNNRIIYNGNIGLCGIVLNYNQIQIGWTAGAKLYYGPEFIPLHYYEDGGYYIYFDSSATDQVGNKFDLGIDSGVLLYTNKLVLGIKYDTARKQIRYLCGWSFPLSRFSQKKPTILEK